MERTLSRNYHKNSTEKGPIRFIDFLQQENLDCLELDWKEIASLDLDKLVRTRNTEVLLKLLPQILYCKPEAEFDPDKTDPGFRKVFHLCQIILEYVLHKYQALDIQLKTLEDENQKLEHDVKRIMDEIKTCNDTNIAHINKCMYCGKRFANSKYLQAHMQRRHQGLPHDPSSASSGSFTSQWTIPEEPSEAEVSKKAQGHYIDLLTASSSTQTDLSFQTTKELEQAKLTKIIHCIEFLSKNCDDIEIISKSQMDRIYTGFQLYHENLDKRLDQIQEIAEELEQSKHSLNLKDLSFSENPEQNQVVGATEDVMSDVPEEYLSLCKLLEQQLQGQDKQIERIRQFIQHDMAEREMEAIKMLKFQDEKVQSGLSVIQTFYKNKLEEMRQEIKDSVTKLAMTTGQEDEELEKNVDIEVLNKSWTSESDTETGSYTTSVVYKSKTFAPIKSCRLEMGDGIGNCGVQEKGKSSKSGLKQGKENISHHNSSRRAKNNRKNVTINEEFEVSNIRDLTDSKLMSKSDSDKTVTSTQAIVRKRKKVPDATIPTNREQEMRNTDTVSKPTPKENLGNILKSDYTKSPTNSSRKSKMEHINKPNQHSTSRHYKSANTGISSKMKSPRCLWKDAENYNLSSDSEYKCTDPTFGSNNETKKRLARTTGFDGMFDSGPEKKAESQFKETKFNLKNEEEEYTDGMEFFGLPRPKSSSFDNDSDRDYYNFGSGGGDSGRKMHSPKKPPNFLDRSRQPNQDTSSEDIQLLRPFPPTMTTPTDTFANINASLKTILNRIQFKRTQRATTNQLINLRTNVMNMLAGANFPGPNPELYTPYKAAAHKESHDGTLKPILVKSRPKKWSELH